MYIIKRRLLSLQLALLLCVVPALPPASAAEAFSTSAARRTGEGTAATPVAVAEDARLETDGPVSSAALQAVSGSGGSSGGGSSYAPDPYGIVVGGRAFYSDTAASGKGWSYDPEYALLTLDGYNSTEIRASGDLRIYCEGPVTITAANHSSYPYGGITVNGSLSLSNYSGESVSIKGGNATSSGNGGAAIDCEGLDLFGEKFTLRGGSGRGASSFGGAGILAGELDLYGDCDVRGGDSNTGLGGPGLEGDVIYIGSDVCSIRGGTGGASGAPAVFFYSDCTLGLTNATLTGTKGQYPIQGEGDDPIWYYNEHTDCVESVSGTDQILRVTIHQYTLTLNGGKGSNWNGSSSASYTDEYCHYYSLFDERFHDDGRTQVGWQDASENFFPLNNYYAPEKDTTLTAVWAENTDGTVLLNALRDTFDDGYIYRSYPAPVYLPPLDGDRTLAFWTGHPGSSAENYVVPGACYMEGDLVTPTAGQATVLYPAVDGSNTVVRYHTSGIPITEGGSILVQTNLPSFDLQPYARAYAVDDAKLDVPSTYRLKGWSDRENSSTINYTPGQEMAIPLLETTDLYAVWEKLGHELPGFEDGTLLVAPEARTVSVTVPASWFEQNQVSAALLAVYQNGKMAGVRVAEYKGQDVALELEYPSSGERTLKWFRLGDDYQPKGAAAWSLDLSAALSQL